MACLIPGCGNDEAAMIAIGGPRNSDIIVRAQAVKGRSLWVDARRRLLRNRAAMAGIIILAIVALMAIFAPMLSQYSFSDQDYDVITCAPDWWPGDVSCRAGGTHWFGTDAVGRDLFVRVLYGARVSLSVGLIATAVSLLIGVLYGSIAGYLGGRADNWMMRAVDVLYSLPFVFFVIILMVLFDRSLVLMFVAIGAMEWLTMARIVRGQTLSIKQKEFIEAARAAGVSGPGIILRHIIPNVTGPVVVYVTLTVPGVILTESFLSFLGLGVQEPLTSWGVLISDGANQNTAPWLLVFPALFMAVTLFCFNFIGDGLRDALDPKDR
jgi:oligopeptide transport system permease protein